MSISSLRQRSYVRTDCELNASMDQVHHDEIYCARVRAPGASNDDMRLSVRLAGTEGQRNLARTLVNRMYSWRGYGSDHQLPARDTHSTFTASVDDEVVGTITLAVDGSGGLAADAIFRDEINSFRRVPGAQVCELTKLAFDTAMPSRELLACLFHVVFIYGQRSHRCTDLFIEVNPRHRRFYEAMLGFKPIGDVKNNSSVDAPAQLMWLKVADIGDQIKSYAGRKEQANVRSLYPFFLSGHDESHVQNRLVRSIGSRNGSHRLVARMDRSRWASFSSHGVMQSA